MDSKSRQTLQPIWGLLPPGFSGEKYDDFINCADPEGKAHSQCRVLRVVGAQRYLVLFAYDQNPFNDSHRVGRSYRLLYLKDDGSLAPLDTKQIEAQWQAQHQGRRTPFPWEKEIARWLGEHGARQYVGTNWAGRISGDLVGLLQTWRRDLSSIPLPEGHDL